MSVSTDARCGEVSTQSTQRMEVAVGIGVRVRVRVCVAMSVREVRVERR